MKINVESKARLRWPCIFQNSYDIVVKLRMFYFSKVAFRILFTVLVLEVSNSEKPNDQKDVNVKDIAEEWFTKQATGSLGKKFLEKVKCKKFITYFQENYPQVYLSSSKYSNDEISSVVRFVSLFHYSPFLCEKHCIAV